MTDVLAMKIETSINKLVELSRKPALSAVLLSPQKRHFCPYEIRSAEIAGIRFDVLPDITDVVSEARRYDICIVCGVNEGDEALLFNLRHQNVASLYFSWLWDHHHHQLDFIRTAVLADVVFVSHWFSGARDYLNHPLVLPGSHVPCFCRQWSPTLMAKSFPRGLPTDRGDEPYGGFGRYQWLSERNRFIDELRHHFPSIWSGDIEDYFRLPIEDRLGSWVGRKVHLVIPVYNDVSIRIWEALMTGQIPLVPHDVPDLELIVSKELQESLPIIRYEPLSVESVLMAWRTALDRFIADGPAGIQRRHEYARDHHSLESRLSMFARFVRRQHTFNLRVVGGTMRWKAWLSA